MSFHSAPIRRILFSAFLPILLWHTLAIAESADTTSLVKAALEKLDATDLDADWFFTMEVLEEDELRVIRSDPHRAKDDRRQLLSVNGAAPDEAHLEKFRDAEEKRIGDIDPEKAGYTYMVDTDTLHLLERGDEYLKVSFIPRIVALEESREQMQGTLLLNTLTQQIEQIEIYNTEKLSPAFSVTVDTFRLALAFQQEQGEILLHKLESHAVGKAGFLKSFNSLVAVAFSDYRRAAL
jgi:hypothetical protein